MARPATYIALDVGTRTIGVARALADARVPAPWFTLSRKGVRRDVDALLARVDGAEVAAWIVGLPLENDGTEQRMARLARQVGEALADRTGLPVHYVDERYSSVEAQRRLVEAGIRRGRSKGRLDEAAAAVILQRWLDGTG